MSVSSESCFDFIESNKDTIKNKSHKNQLDILVKKLKKSKNAHFEEEASWKNEKKWTKLFCNLTEKLMHIDNSAVRKLSSLLYKQLVPVMSPELVKHSLNYILHFDLVEKDVDNCDSLEPSLDKECIDDEESLTEMEENDGDSDNSEEDYDESGSSDEEITENDAYLKGKEKLKIEMAKGFTSYQDVDIDEADEEELDNFDKRLSMLMKEHIPSKSLVNIRKKKKHKREMAELNVRLRAIDLLKTVIAHAVSDNQLVPVVFPLIVTLATEEDEKMQSKLREAAAQLAENRSMKYKSELSEKYISGEMEKLFKVLEDDSNRDITIAAYCGLRFLTRAGSHICEQSEGDTHEVIELLRKYLKDLFTNKASKLDYRHFCNSIFCFKKHLSILLDDLRRYGFSKTKQTFKKRSALQILKVAFKNRIAISAIPGDSLKELQKNISSDFIKVLKSIKKPSNINIKYHKTFFELLVAIQCLHKKDASLAVGFNTESLRCEMRKLNSRCSFTPYIAKLFGAAAASIGLKDKIQCGKGKKLVSKSKKNAKKKKAKYESLKKTGFKKKDKDEIKT